MAVKYIPMGLFPPGCLLFGEQINNLGKQKLEIKWGNKAQYRGNKQREKAATNAH